MPHSAGVLGWFDGRRSHPVVLSDPYPVGECLRRLATVTTRRGFTWYLTSKNARRPNPRLRGRVGLSGILVAQFEDTLRRDSFVPWLNIRPEPAAGGGRILAGRIGLHPAVRMLTAVISGAGDLIALGGLVVGVVQLVSGQAGTALPFVVIPLILIAGIMGVNAVGSRSMERKIPKLIQEMNEIIGSGRDGAGS
jgi:hypothetical protein